MKKVFLYIMLVAVSFTMQSCLHDNEETFDRSAAERIDDAVSNAKNILLSADNGWHLEYYLGIDYAYGGYNFLINFGSDGKASVASEIAPSDMTTSSSWDIVKDQGPVLTFDTYNEIMHYLAQPYQDDVDGLEGDYEFIIMKATNDSIYLKGKKWGNEMLLTRMPSNVSWEDYLDKIAAMPDSIVSYIYDAQGQDATIELDQDNNQCKANVAGEDIEIPFVYTTTGIKLRTPLAIGSTKVQLLTFKGVTGDDQSFEDNGVTLKGRPVPGRMAYEELTGTYLFTTWSNRKITVTADGDGVNYTLTNFSPYGTVKATYNKKFGSLIIPTQPAGTYFGVYNLWLCPCDGATFTWDTSQVFTGRNDVAEDGTFSITFYNSSYPAFWLMAFQGDASSDNFAGTLNQMSGTKPMTLVKQ